MFIKKVTEQFYFLATVAKVCEMFIFASAFKISIGPSSNGRTTVFGTVYIGSNPVGPTEEEPLALCEGLFILATVRIFSRIFDFR